MGQVLITYAISEKTNRCHMTAGLETWYELTKTLYMTVSQQDIACSYIDVTYIYIYRIGIRRDM